MLGQRHRYSITQKIWSAVTGLVMVALLFGPAFTPGSSVSAQSSTFGLNSVVATTTGLNLREQPAGDSAVVVQLAVNARGIVIGGPFNDYWYWLDFNGTRGYASGRFLVLVDENYKPVSTETATAVSTPTQQATATPQATATATAIVPVPVTTSAAGTATATQAAGTPTTTPMPDYTAPTVPGDYTGLWLAEMSTGGNVRSGPGIDKSLIKSWWPGRRVLLYQAALDSKGGTWYRVSEPPEAPMWVHSSLIRRVAPVKFEPARYRGRWVNVNISQQVVIAYEGGKPVKVTLASTGKGKNETNLGVWKIYWRLPKQDMEGGNKAAGDYYKLKDVPFPQYFNTTGESLHGTYWHDDFGHVHSHGCVNLSTPIAGWFYGWASIGTIVYVHN